MSEAIDGPIEHSVGKGTVRLHPEKLGREPTFTSSRRSDRKYNLRVREQDLMLLDALAKHVGRPRSDLINELLHRILLKELQALEEPDAMALVALRADQDAAYDPLALPWTFDALESEINALIRNVLEHNQPWEAQPLDLPQGMSDEEKAECAASLHSETFNILKAKIDGFRK